MRQRQNHVQRGAAAVAAAMAAALAVGSAADRAPSDGRGKEIYAAGTAASGRPVTASLGVDGTPLPASLLPCVNCHGTDGRGKAEGGVVPSDVTWVELTKPYRTETINGRRRPSYDEATVARAIARGIDSAGNPLNAAMPRYDMAAEEMADLVAYLKVLGGDTVPGVGATSIRVATFVPSTGPAAVLGRQMTSVLSAFFAEAGEIHGRRIELEAIELTPDLRSIAEAVEHAVADEPPFAVVGGLISGADQPIADVIERKEIPLVLPVSAVSDSSAANRQRFYLTPGLGEQLTALLRFSARDKKTNRWMVIARDEQNVALARRALTAAGVEDNVVVTGPSSDTAGAHVTIDAATTVLYLDPDLPLRSLLSTAGRGSSWLFLAPMLPADFFEAAAGFDGRMLIASAMTPSHITGRGLAEYRAFASRHGIPPRHLASELSAYAAANVFLHALKKSGRDLTRESLREALESLYDFQTGVSPPLTFGRSRRVGSARVYISSMDRSTKRLIPIGDLLIDDSLPPPP